MIHIHHCPRHHSNGFPSDFLKRVPSSRMKWFTLFNKGKAILGSVGTLPSLKYASSSVLQLGMIPSLSSTNSSTLWIAREVVDFKYKGSWEPHSVKELVNRTNSSTHHFLLRGFAESVLPRTGTSFAHRPPHTSLYAHLWWWKSPRFWMLPIVNPSAPKLGLLLLP